MDLTQIVGVLLTVTATFAYLNYRFLRLPMTIGLMAAAIVFSLVLLLLERLGIDLRANATQILKSVDFSATLMNGMLAYLLFAGALHVKSKDLRANFAPIAVLATAGVIISTLVVGFLLYGACQVVGVDVPLAYALVFGALISPTDPIAVLSILKTAGIDKDLETQIAGESLFNDGVGVVVYLAILGIAVNVDTTLATLPWREVGVLFLKEAGGGILLGLGLGYASFVALRSIDDYKTEILITIAVVAGGTALASAIHVSSPLAMVVAGIFIGNQGRAFAMSTQTVERLDDFWELVDEVLNAVLFVLIGLELLILPFRSDQLFLGFLAIPIVLLARFVAVAGPVSLMKRRRSFTPGTIRIMTWGGLRGGISVALALQIPQPSVRDTLLILTYCVVVFSILAQGLTVGRLVKGTVGPTVDP